MQRLFYHAVLGVTVLCLGSLAFAEDNAAEYNNMGIKAYNGGRFAESIRYFEKAHELARDNGTVRHNLCNAYQATANELAKQNKYAEAIEPLKTAISVEPQNAAPLIQLGSYHLQLDQTQQAIFRLEEAIQLKAGDLTAHELLGEAYYRDNDIPSARVQWDYVLKMDPNRKALKERYAKAFREQSVETGYKRSGSRHFNLSCATETPSLVRSQVLTILEDAYVDIGRKLDGVYPPSPIQVILYGDGEFAQATKQGENIAALYDGKIREPLTDGKGGILPQAELDRRLRHEYVHVALRAMAGSAVPWWVNEGLAETLTRDLDAAEADLLRGAGAAGLALPLSSLGGEQLSTRSPEQLSVAYAHAHAAVQTLWNRYGQRSFLQMLQSIAQGMKGEEALKKTYNMTYAELETELMGNLP